MRAVTLVVTLSSVVAQASFAAAAPARPAGVLAIVDCGAPASEIAALRTALTKLAPHAPALSLETLPATLGKMVGLTTLDGVDTAKPLHALFLNPQQFPQPVVLIGAVANAKALNASLATATGAAPVAHVKGGYAVVGLPAALDAAEAYAQSLAHTPPPPGIRAVAFVQTIWATFSTQFLALRQMIGALTGKDNPLLSGDMLNGLFDGFAALISDTDELTVDAAVQGSQLVFGFAIKAKSDTVVDRFFLAQHAAAFGSLARLGAVDASIVGAGTLNSTPELRKLFHDWMLRSYTKLDAASLAQLEEFQKLWDGDAAIAGNFLAPGQPEFQIILGTSDAKRATALLPAAAKVNDLIVSSFGTSVRTPRPSYTYNGVAVSAQSVTQDFSKLAGHKGPAKTTTEMQWAGFDQMLLTAVGMRSADATDRMHKLIDSAHSGLNPLVLTASAQSSLAAARAEKASFWMFLDLGEMPNATPDTHGLTATVAYGFANHTARMTTIVGR